LKIKKYYIKILYILSIIGWIYMNYNLALPNSKCHHNGFFSEIDAIWSDIDKIENLSSEHAIVIKNILDRSIPYLSGKKEYPNFERKLKDFIKAVLEIEGIFTITQEQASKVYSMLCQPKVVAIAVNDPAINLVSCESESPSSFSDYREKREAEGEPVDLLIGRGRENKHFKQHDQRYFPEKKKFSSYRPFFIDINSKVIPDYVADMTNPQEMSYCPSSSVDEMYFEGIFPVTPQINLKTYCNAARILKLNGIFIMDANYMCSVPGGGDDRLKIKIMEKKFEEIFSKYNIPLRIYCDDRIERNAFDEKERKLAFFKYAEYENNLMSDEIKLQQAQEEINIFQGKLKYGDS
jgi:hypothetical protein